MTPKLTLRKVIVALVVFWNIAMLLPGEASALDAAGDRTGLFWGTGFGGGGAIAVPTRNAGVDVNFDIQLGAGVSAAVTVDFDVDIWTVIFNGERNIIVNPGPEVNYFFGDTGLFVRGGIGAAMNTINAGKNSEFEVGFDTGLGVGWEFFTNDHLAIGVAAEGDYIVRRSSDFAIVGVMCNLRYY